MLTIVNDGPEIVRANFWDGVLNAAGKFFVSFNAGAVRLLVPDALLGSLLPEFQVTKTVRVERAGTVMHVVLDDGSKDPFTFEFNERSVDRLPPASDSGREFIFSAWGRGPVKVFQAKCRLVVK